MPVTYNYSAAVTMAVTLTPTFELRDGSDNLLTSKLGDPIVVQRTDGGAAVNLPFPTLSYGDTTTTPSYAVALSGTATNTTSTPAPVAGVCE